MNCSFINMAYYCSLTIPPEHKPPLTGLIIEFNLQYNLFMIKRFFIVLAAVVGLAAFTACSDDDDPVNVNDLPVNVKAFVATYFPASQIVDSQLDGGEYEVTLSNGTQIDFNLSGEWTDVDAPLGQSVPPGFYPPEIDNYLALNMPGAAINEISREPQGYDVELVNGTEMIFGFDGSFLGYDPF